MSDRHSRGTRDEPRRREERGRDYGRDYRPRKEERRDRERFVDIILFEIATPGILLIP